LLIFSVLTDGDNIYIQQIDLSSPPVGM